MGSKVTRACWGGEAGLFRAYFFFHAFGMEGGTERC